jgi:hypothetical protein
MKGSRLAGNLYSRERVTYILKLFTIAHISPVISGSIASLLNTFDKEYTFPPYFYQLRD